MALILSPRAPLLGLLYPSKLLEDEYMLLLVLLLRSCTHARTHVHISKHNLRLHPQLHHND